MLKKNNDFPPITRSAYWREAVAVMSQPRMMVFAALIIALRVAVKFFSFQIVSGVEFSFDCYVNSLGSLVYGPVMGLAVGAVSDTLGCILHPTGPYFPPFILVEMSSSFLFGLFLWKRPLSVPRVLLSKFTVNTVCNIVLTSLFIKWEYSFFDGEAAYSLINLVRIVKNLILFPLEAVLIAGLCTAVQPALESLGLIPKKKRLALRWQDYLLVGILFLLSVGLVLFYIFFLKDFVYEHNIKWL